MLTTGGRPKQTVLQLAGTRSGLRTARDSSMSTGRSYLQVNTQKLAAPRYLGRQQRKHSWKRQQGVTCGLLCVNARARQRRGLRASDLDFAVPEVGEDLRYFQEEAGAEFSESGVALTFGNDPEAREALQTGVVVVDQSHCGRLRVTGPDASKFLQAQSTNEFLALQPGQGCDTVFVTAQARTIELASCYVLQPASIMVATSAGMTQTLCDRLNKYIFFGDEVSVRNVSDECCMLVVAGPASSQLLKSLGVPEKLLLGAHASHGLFNVGGKPVLVAAGSGLHHNGYTLIGDEGNAGDLWTALTDKGAVPMGEAEWEHARIISGRPMAGRELTEDHTPLEAGLWSAVDLGKGCYIGQETLAKVSKLGALNRELWGLHLGAAAQLGDPVTADDSDRDLGVVTSVTEVSQDSYFALAYLRCKSRGQHRDLEGLQLQVGGNPGTVTAIPYATRSFPAAAVPAINEPVAVKPASAPVDGPASGLTAVPAGDKAPNEEQKRKLQAMQERLRAWQQQQEQ